MFELKEQNIIVRGSLNPAIIQPNWLSKIGFIPKGKRIEMKLSVGANLPSEFNWANHYYWSIDNSMIKVTVPPDHPQNKLSEFISTVFAKLEHTPVTAIGQNFIFDGEPDEAKANFSANKKWAVNEKSRWGSILILKNEMTFIRDEISRINVYLTNDLEKSRVQLNFHYDVESTEQVRKFSEKVDENFKLANEILREIVGK